MDNQSELIASAAKSALTSALETKATSALSPAGPMSTPRTAEKCLDDDEDLPMSRRLLFSFQLTPGNQTRVDIASGPLWAAVVPARILRQDELVALFEEFLNSGYMIDLDVDGFPVVHKNFEAYKFVRGRKPDRTSTNLTRRTTKRGKSISPAEDNKNVTDLSVVSPGQGKTNQLTTPSHSVTFGGTTVVPPSTSASCGQESLLDDVQQKIDQDTPSPSLFNRGSAGASDEAIFPGAPGISAAHQQDVNFHTHASKADDEWLKRRKALVLKSGWRRNVKMPVEEKLRRKASIKPHGALKGQRNRIPDDASDLWQRTCATEDLDSPVEEVQETHNYKRHRDGSTGAELVESTKTIKTTKRTKAEKPLNPAARALLKKLREDDLVQMAKQKGLQRCASRLMGKRSTSIPYVDLMKKLRQAVRKITEPEPAINQHAEKQFIPLPAVFQQKMRSLTSTPKPILNRNRSRHPASVQKPKTPFKYERVFPQPAREVHIDETAKRVSSVRSLAGSYHFTPAKNSENGKETRRPRSAMPAGCKPADKRQSGKKIQAIQEDFHGHENRAKLKQQMSTNELDEFSWKMEAGLKALADLKKQLKEIATKNTFPSTGQKSSEINNARQASGANNSTTSSNVTEDDYDSMEGDRDAAGHTSMEVNTSAASAGTKAFTVFAPDVETDMPSTVPAKAAKEAIVKKALKEAAEKKSNKKEAKCGKKSDFPIELVCNLSFLFKYDKKYLDQLNKCLAKMDIPPISSEVVEKFLNEVANPKTSGSNIRDLKIRGQIEVWPESGTDSKASSSVEALKQQKNEKAGEKGVSSAVSTSVMNETDSQEVPSARNSAEATASFTASVSRRALDDAAIPEQAKESQKVQNSAAGSKLMLPRKSKAGDDHHSADTLGESAATDLHQWSKAEINNPAHIIKSPVGSTVKCGAEGFVFGTPEVHARKSRGEKYRERTLREIFAEEIGKDTCSVGVSARQSPSMDNCQQAMSASKPTSASHTTQTLFSQNPTSKSTRRPMNRFFERVKASAGPVSPERMSSGSASSREGFRHQQHEQRESLKRTARDLSPIDNNFNDTNDHQLCKYGPASKSPVAFEVMNGLQKLEKDSAFLLDRNAGKAMDLPKISVALGVSEESATMDKRMRLKGSFFGQNTRDDPPPSAEALELADDVKPVKLDKKDKHMRIKGSFFGHSTGEEPPHSVEVLESLEDDNKATQPTRNEHLAPDRQRMARTPISPAPEDGDPPLLDVPPVEDEPDEYYGASLNTSEANLLAIANRNQTREEPFLASLRDAAASFVRKSLTFIHGEQAEECGSGTKAPTNPSQNDTKLQTRPGNINNTSRKLADDVEAAIMANPQQQQKPQQVLDTFVVTANQKGAIGPSSTNTSVASSLSRSYYEENTKEVDEHGPAGPVVASAVTPSAGDAAASKSVASLEQDVVEMIQQVISHTGSHKKTSNKKIKLSKKENLIVMCGGDIIFDIRNAKDDFVITLCSKSGTNKYVSHTISIDKKAGKVGVDCSVREGEPENPFLPKKQAETAEQK